MIPLLEPDNKTNEARGKMSDATNANAKHSEMYTRTQTIMNRLLRNQTHYESVRLLRNIDWSYILLVACTVRTRLELQMSFDPFLEAILNRVGKLAETIDTALEREWKSEYDQKALGQEIVNVLFTPAASETNAAYRVTSREPDRINVQEVFELVVNGEHSESAERVLQTLLRPSVRRLCLLQKTLAGKWITAVEKANWWRICAELQGKP